MSYPIEFDPAVGHLETSTVAVMRSEAGEPPGQGSRVDSIWEVEVMKQAPQFALRPAGRER